MRSPTLSTTLSEEQEKQLQAYMQKHGISRREAGRRIFTAGFIAIAAAERRPPTWDYQQTPPAM